MNKWTYKQGILTLSSRFEEGGYDIEIYLRGIVANPVTLYTILNYGVERVFFKNYASIEEVVEATRKLT